MINTDFNPYLASRNEFERKVCYFKPLKRLSPLGFLNCRRPYRAENNTLHIIINLSFPCPSGPLLEVHRKGGYRI